MKHIMNSWCWLLHFSSSFWPVARNSKTDRKVNKLNCGIYAHTTLNVCYSVLQSYSLNTRMVYLLPQWSWILLMQIKTYYKSIFTKESQHKMINQKESGMINLNLFNGYRKKKLRMWTYLLIIVLRRTRILKCW